VRDNSQQKIEVYDAKTFTLQRHITVPGLSYSCYGLAACPYNNCLYASNFQNDSVHRVDVRGINAATTWSVAQGPAGLSVNNEHNLLVVSERERKIQIITTDGTLLQNVQLQAVAPEPLGTGGHGPLHSETVGGHGGAQKALNVANAMLEMEIKQ